LIYKPIKIKKMKTLKVLKLMFFVFSLTCPNLLFAQANVINNVDVEVYLTRPSKTGEGRDTVYSLTSGIEKVVISSSLNILRILTFTVDKDNPILELANPVALFRIKATADFDGDEIPDILYGNAVLTKNGRLKIIYH